MNLKLTGVMIAALAVLSCGCSLKPQPMTWDEISSRAKQDRTDAFTGQEPVSGPVSLYEAMARAIKYNLDHRTALMEKALAGRQMEAARYELLPRLAANAGYNHSSEYYGASSMALTGPTAGTESLVTSTSRDKENRTADITMMWNILDFGVSYLAAKQEADHYLIMEEERRKAVQIIIQDVRHAYWRAQAAVHLLPRLRQTLEETRSALDRAEQIAGKKIQPLHITLEYQQALLENIRLIRGLILQMGTAKDELATLMNLPPGSDFSLIEVDWESLEVPQIKLSLDVLETMALTLRPELRQEDYKQRISVQEARKAILEMLPGVSLNFGLYYDSNSFLYRNDWATAGTAVSMNLFNLISGPAKYKAAKARQELDTIRRTAMTMAVLTQVHLAVRQFMLIRDEYDDNLELALISEKLHQVRRNNALAGKGDELSAILSHTNAMVTAMRHHMVYAEMQNAMGRIYFATGVDPVVGLDDSAGIEELTQALKKQMKEI